MPDRRLTIEVRDGTQISALLSGPRSGAAWVVVYAPGAGSNLHDPFGKHLAETLAARDVAVVRFQFPYMESGRKSPDRADVLEATWRAVIESVRSNDGKLAVSGRSMGGRIASMALADGVTADALALFAYPLHPPGKPEQTRDAHLPSIKARALFVSGTNDAFGAPHEIRNAASKVKRSSVHLLEGADHGFAARKSSGRTKQDVFDEATDALIKWLKA